ncbi:MAG: hypothetical protein KC478_14840 [Bacteriovoracaceae bacterium]|nr:hypothetical protein [Bacteriovoracaceae bacterium]
MKKEICALCELLHNKTTPSTCSQEVFAPGQKSISIKLCPAHDKEFFLKGQDSFIRQNWNKLDKDNSTHSKLIRTFSEIQELRSRNVG